MAKILSIHPVDPQKRFICQVVDTLRKGGVVVYPTDSGYALGCHIGDKTAMQRIRKIREVDEKHNFTLMCRDLSELAIYAKVSNQAFRLMKGLTPGPYTFILQATREVPRRLQNPRRRTIGLRVPANPIAIAILEEIAEPFMSSTLILPGEELPMTDMDEIEQHIGHAVDVIIDGGYCGLEPTTIVDLVSDEPEVLRFGKGAVDFLIQ